MKTKIFLYLNLLPINDICNMLQMIEVFFSIEEKALLLLKNNT